MFKNDFVKTSRYLFGSHLGFERFNYFDLTNFSSFCIWNFSNNSHPPMVFQDKLCNFGILPFPSSSLDIQILTFIFDN
jgi:hypothetical protein